MILVQGAEGNFMQQGVCSGGRRSTQNKYNKDKWRFIDKEEGREVSVGVCGGVSADRRLLKGYGDFW